MKRETFLQALLLNNRSNTIPVWLMRQAGRYMESYRTLRKKYSFEQLCFTPELCVEVTLQPIMAFDFDAAILFSDILFPLRTLGVEVSFSDAGPEITPLPPKIDLPKNCKEALQSLLQPCYRSATLLRQILDRPLIGFSGAPFTLAAFLLKANERDTWIHTEPSKLHALVSMLEKIVVAHLQLQIEAGCQAVQIFDSLSHIVPPHLLGPLCIDPLNRILSQLPPTPVIYYKATNALLASLPKIPLSLSSDVDVAPLSTDHTRVLQGNLDPSFLKLPHHLLQQKVRHICSLMKGHPGFIFNLSSGIPKDTPEDVIARLVNTVRTLGTVAK